MQTIKGINVFGSSVDNGALEQMIRCSKDAVLCALMADHHKGYALPIGGVIAYDGKISPSGVGYDIGCGNKAIRVGATKWDIQDRLPQIMDAIEKAISFGVGQKNHNIIHHPLFSDYAWKMGAVAPLLQMAREQFGTVGSGNHYVDIFADETDDVWIGVHFGSRGLGHKIATHFLKAGGAKDGMDVDPLLLDVGTPLGIDYLEAMRLAGAYASAGRDWVCDQVAAIIGAPITDSVHNHHNYAWKEGGLWVIRKGATPLVDGQRCFVGGSMGDKSYILQGVSSLDLDAAMHSTVHGAGRVMSRSQAKRTISQEEMNGRLEAIGVILRGGGLDEAPQAYKSIEDVVQSQGDSVRVVHTLRPLGVCMAGAGEFDPYKD